MTDLTMFERDRLNYGESLGPAMEITEQADADAYFAAYVTWLMRVNEQTLGEAEHVARVNLGYYAGYYSAEAMERVNRLFRTAHPILGLAPVTPESALGAGRVLGNRMKREAATLGRPRG
jgi:hypothetical protein